ncbi:DUF418 domain-containing protein [Hyphobacterium sp.]|uniref:DUF418 domain-containing protein n=1 Tax=Hyphobacterium sp. TaxID=2004662 RepID=UPI003BA87014
MAETQAASAPAEAPPPAPKRERFTSIDTLRGIAVLGILMMNVQAFAMWNMAYQYPPAHMDLTGANLDAWFYSHVFFGMKFITIFSALFGAGIILMLGEDKSLGTRQHYPRMLWLLLIGMIHAYVFWFGDILVSYALAGMLVVMARHKSALWLTIWGLILVAIPGLLMVGLFASFGLIPGEVTPEKFQFVLPPEELQEIVATYQAGFLDRLPMNALSTVQAQIGGIILFGGRIVGVMFLGMALFKTGFFTLRWNSFAYLITAAVTLGIGIPLAWIGAAHDVATNFEMTSLWYSIATNYVASLLMALGYGAVIMFLCKIKLFQLILYPFTAAGRMAFTNYLTQTLAMTYVFVGPPGMGLFGTVERIDQVKIVVVVWIVQLIVSPLWLSVFRFGPFEWLWRSLTYGSFQPLLKGRAPAPSGPPGG